MLDCFQLEIYCITGITSGHNAAHLKKKKKRYGLYGLTAVLLQHIYKVQWCALLIAYCVTSCRSLKQVKRPINFNEWWKKLSHVTSLSPNHTVISIAWHKEVPLNTMSWTSSCALQPMNEALWCKHCPIISNIHFLPWRDPYVSQLRLLCKAGGLLSLENYC